MAMSKKELELLNNLKKYHNEIASRQDALMNRYPTGQLVSEVIEIKKAIIRIRKVIDLWEGEE